MQAPWTVTGTLLLGMAVSACSTGPSGSAPGGDATAEEGDGAPGSDANPASGDGAPGSDANPANGDGAPDGAAPPAVQWIGRFDRSDASQPTAEWSASAMRARFSGTSVSAQLGGANFFAVSVDGVDQPVIATHGAALVPIATGLGAGTHDVLVVRRDEAFDKPSQLVGFDFGSGGQLLAAPPQPAHRLEVIGDSISAGYGDECTNASVHFTAPTENANLAYGPLTARALGAEIHLIAWSGKGLYRNLDGSLTETMPILWQRTLPTDPTSHWDPSQWSADAVVINLGTNDYNAPGGDPSSDYESTYLAFVTQLRDAYPDAFLFCAVGPMLAGTQYAAVRTAITSVIATRSAAGDARLKLVEFPSQDCKADGSGCGCDYHPNLAEHQAMALVLEGAIHDTLGW